MFDRLDADHNGSITREEMSQARAQHQARRGERHGEHGRGPGGPGMRPSRSGGPAARRRPACAAQRMFGEQGFVTREQFRERALARFDRADADHDGTLTAAERQAARAQQARSAATSAADAELERRNAAGKRRVHAAPPLFFLDSAEISADCG